MPIDAPKSEALDGTRARLPFKLLNYDDSASDRLSIITLARTTRPLTSS